MTSRFSTLALAILLAVSLIAPSVFLLVPQRVHAIPVEVVADASIPSIKTMLSNAAILIKQTLSTALDITNTAAGVAMQLNAFVFQPLAFAVSGDLLKSITSSVLNFVVYKANGTGLPQFITDLNASMRTVGDSQALAFFTEWGKNSNSPFARSVASSLRANYLRNTSLNGFWAANMSTLSKSSRDVNRFLAGDWSQGGAAAWFALTTQDQNNPYMLYQRAQGQLGSLVLNAQNTRTTELNWGQGMMSWCGPLAADSSKGGISPRDPCTNPDGTPGTIQTPGAVIMASLNKVLGADQDKAVRLGNVGPEINSILKNIATVTQTIQFGAHLLGGGGSGGLLTAGTPSGVDPKSRLQKFQDREGNMGVTQSDVMKNSVAYLPSGADMGSRLAQYQSSWGIIRASANAASTSVMALKNYCLGQADASQALINEAEARGDDESLESVRNFGSFIQASRAQAGVAQDAFANAIVPVFSQIAAADAIAAAAVAMVEKVKNEATNASTSPDTYTADTQSLQTMAPTLNDVGSAQQDAQTFGTATASPAGSLSVSGDSIVDRMNLISQNAPQLKSNCDRFSAPSTSGNND